MIDKYFSKTHCDRCGRSLDGVSIMSMFNEDCICMKCKEEERKHPKYKEALEADHAEIRRGNYNFKGIGYPGK